MGIKDATPYTCLKVWTATVSHYVFRDVLQIEMFHQLEDNLKQIFLLKKILITWCCCFFPCSNPDPCLSETAQHEEQTGEQDRGRRAEEDPHGSHHGPPGSAGGENEQDSGFHWKQTEQGIRSLSSSVPRKISVVQFGWKFPSPHPMCQVFTC